MAVVIIGDDAEVKLGCVLVDAWRFKVVLSSDAGETLDLRLDLGYLSHHFEHILLFTIAGLLRVQVLLGPVVGLLCLAVLWED